MCSAVQLHSTTLLWTALLTIQSVLTILGGNSMLCARLAPCELRMVPQQFGLPAGTLHADVTANFFRPAGTIGMAFRLLHPTENAREPQPLVRTAALRVLLSLRETPCHTGGKRAGTHNSHAASRRPG